MWVGERPQALNGGLDLAGPQVIGDIPHVGEDPLLDQASIVLGADLPRVARRVTVCEHAPTEALADRAQREGRVPRRTQSLAKPIQSHLDVVGHGGATPCSGGHQPASRP